MRPLKARIQVWFFFLGGGGTPVFEGDARRRGAPGSLRQNRPQPSRRREGVVPVVVVGHSDADADAATDADADAVADQAPVAVSFRRRSREKVSKKNNFFFQFLYPKSITVAYY